MNTTTDAKTQINELNKQFKDQQIAAKALKKKFDADVDQLFANFRRNRADIRARKDALWEQLKLRRAEAKAERKTAAENKKSVKKTTVKKS